MKTEDLFINVSTISEKYIREFNYPYKILPNIKDIILELGRNLNSDYNNIGNDIWIHKNAKVDESARIIGPCIIDSNAEIRCFAFIRGNVIVGKNSVVGNSCEIKNSILFDYVQVPHFNYVGDSILGYKAHLGAGAIISNLKSDKSNVFIKNNSEVIDTNLKKVGAFLGDYVEIGCNSVINPGTVIGSNTSIYPLTSVRGVIDKDSIVKSMDNIIRKRDIEGV